MTETEKLAVSAAAAAERLAKADRMLKEKIKPKEVAEALGYKNSGSLLACVSSYRKKRKKEAEKSAGAAATPSGTEAPADAPGGTEAPAATPSGTEAPDAAPSVPDAPLPRRGVRSGVIDTGEPGEMADFVKEALHNKTPDSRPYPKTFNIKSPSVEAVKAMEQAPIPAGTPARNQEKGTTDPLTPPTSAYAHEKLLSGAWPTAGELIHVQGPVLNIPSIPAGNFKLLSIQGEFGIYSKDDPDGETIRFLQSVKAFTAKQLLAFSLEISAAAAAFNVK